MADEPETPEKKSSKVVNIADQAFKTARKRKDPPKGPPTDDTKDERPVIRVQNDKLPTILDAADAALGERDVNLFDQSGRLVRITDGVRPTAVVNGLREQVEVTLLREVTVPNLCDRLARVASWERWDARADRYVKIDVPRRVAESLLARSGEWQKISKLRGFVESPTLRDDGSVLDVPGYDKASELYFVGKVPTGYTPPDDTRQAANRALDKIKDALDSLPFVGYEDWSAAIVAILTSLVRRILPSAPMVGITAPAAGTGKSLMADAISIIATGHRAGVLTLGKDEIEGDKRLAGALLAGDAVLALDNIDRPLFGDLICQALTQPVVRIRQLGKGELFATPTNTLIVATANNLDIRGDLKRRVMLIRLDSKEERPELRKFTSDMLADIAAQRGELVHAALTIIRAYFAAGCPDTGITPYGSFDQWSKWCRAPVVWLGLPDPLKASESLREQDPDLVAQRQMFMAWWRIFEDRPVTAGEVIESSKVQENADLAAAVDNCCSERVAARRLASWLRKHRDRVIDGMRLKDTGLDQVTKVMLWKLVK